MPATATARTAIITVDTTTNLRRFIGLTPEWKDCITTHPYEWRRRKVHTESKTLRDSSRLRGGLGPAFTTKTRRRKESPSFWLRLGCSVLLRPSAPLLVRSDTTDLLRARRRASRTRGSVLR